MSKMKSILGLSLMMTSLLITNQNHSPQIRDEYLPEETQEEKKKRQESIYKKINEAKGLKQFFYGENSLYALNRKNADKKAQSNGWL